MKPYQRCKGCLGRRSETFPISAAGWCVDCREARMIEMAQTLARAERERIAELGAELETAE